MRSFEDTRKELRQLFMERGWGIEIEGESLSYYKVYEAMLEFIRANFYSDEPIRGATRAKGMSGISKSAREGRSCPKCNSKWVYYKKSVHTYRCRKCENVFT